MKRWQMRIVGLVLILLIIAAALAWTPDRDPAALRAKYADAHSQFVDLGSGLRVHVRDEGPRDAPAIVLLHGSNASLQTWDPWSQRLSDRYRLIRYDQPGHGLTGPHPKGDYSAAAFVDVLQRVTERLGVKRFVLAGNSMGGWVAWNYALAHPDNLRGLVLVDAAGAPETTAAHLPIDFRIARSPFAPLMLHFTPRWIVAQSVHQSMAVQSAIKPAMIDRYWELLLYPGNRKATQQRFRTRREDATAAAMHGIRTPALLLWGEQDRLIPIAAGRWFATAIPGAEIVTFPGVGHIPMEEAPDASARALDNWMAKLPA